MTENPKIVIEFEKDKDGDWIVFGAYSDPPEFMNRSAVAYLTNKAQMLVRLQHAKEKENNDEV